MLHLIPKAALPFLCLRRGVSLFRLASRSAASFSLPTQRCFPEVSKDFLRIQLFSAYAEVFLSLSGGKQRPSSFLCLRRGVSPHRRRDLALVNFSLPTQRCF